MMKKDEYPLARHAELLERIQGKSYRQSPQDPSDSVILFFSFDIVNSTLYKAINNYGWSVVIDYILNEIEKKVKLRLPSSEVWKLLGDEIIFIKEITEMESISKTIEIIYSILIDYSKRIETGELLKGNRQFSEFASELMRSQQVISLQSCAWLARVTKKDSIECGLRDRFVDNIFEVFEEKAINVRFNEFIGIDIDAGFRVAKETRARRLVLSYELAYILSKQEDDDRTRPYLPRLIIMAYKKLKGVWNNSLYPIIWYYDPQMNKGKSFKETIPYDAAVPGDIYADYLNRRSDMDRLMFEDVDYALEKICEDRRLEGHLQSIKDVVLAKDDTDKPPQYINNPTLELHCSVVCYDADGRILLLKRCNTVDYADKWEFGSEKAERGKPIAQTVREKYEEDFGIQIRLHMDEDRQDAQPIPLAMYSVTKGRELHTGVVFLAEIMGGIHNDTIVLNSSKYQDFRFISRAEADILNPADFVSDALDTMRKAFAKIGSREDTQMPRA